MTKRLSAAVLALAIAACLHAVLPAQQPPNVNINSTKPDPGHPEGDQYVADPWRQRTVEPAVAVNPLNPDQLVAASNQYSIVDFPDDNGTGEGTQLARRLSLSRKGLLAAVADAWIGLYFSYDRGQHWINMLHPGHQFDTSQFGTSLPIFGRTAASDPVLTAAPGSGRFYLGGMYFDRGGFGQIGVTVLESKNDDSKHPTFIKKFGVVDNGSATATGNFADKGAIRADVARGNASFGKVFFSYTLFTGLAGANQIRVSVSTDGGESWSKAKKVNGTLSGSQGSTIAINPNTGLAYVVWRRFSPDQIIWVNTADGKSSSPPMPVGPPGFTTICAYDSQTLPPPSDMARTLGFPSAEFDNHNRLHVVFQARERNSDGTCNPVGMPRIFLTTGTVNPANGNITSWTIPTAIDTSPRCEATLIGDGPTEVSCNTPGATLRPAGPQWKPSISHSGGQLLIVYKEGRIDNEPSTPDLDTNGFPSGIERRVDMRAARVKLSLFPTLSVTTGQISRYDFDPATSNVVESNPGEPDGHTTAEHRESLRMYQSGTRAFGGDYEGVAAFTQFVSGSPWHWATDAEVPSPSAAVVWYDTRNVKFPKNGQGFPDINGDWTAYTKPDPASQDPGCNPGSRDSAIYFAEVDEGSILSTPQTFKQMGGTNGQVTYAVTLRNRTKEKRQFKLTLLEALNSPVEASWFQFFDKDVLGEGPVQADGSCPNGTFPQNCTPRATILPRSSVTLTVFATGPDPSPNNAITVLAEDETPNATPLPDAILRLNQVPQTDIPAATEDETHTPGIGTPGITPGIGTGGPSSAPGIGTPGIGTPGIGTPGIGTKGLTEYTDVIFPVTNEPANGANVNTSSGFTSFLNLANETEIAEDHLLQVIIVTPASNTSVSGCGAADVPYDQLVSFIPGTPGIGTPGIGTPGIGTPGIGTNGISNATFSLAPSSSVGGSHQPNMPPHSLRDPDTKFVVVRAWHCHNPSGCPVPSDLVPGGMLQFEDPNDPNAESFPDTLEEVASGLVLSVAAQANPKEDGFVDPDDQVVVTSQAPDLIIDSGTPAVSPTSVSAGGAVQFPVNGWRLKNVGTFAAPAPFSHGYYLSTDETIDTSDVLLATETTTASLAINATQIFGQRTLAIPPGTSPGTYFIGILVDRNNNVAEQSEGNNSAAVALTVTAADPGFTFVVTNTNDSGPGSLRQAVLDSNANAGNTDTILFSLPGAGPHTITPSTPLPGLNDAVVIDATPAGACSEGVAPTIRLDGASAGLSHGFVIAAGGTTIRGLSITGFAPSNPFAGIFVAGGGSSVIECNYLGLAPDGLTVGANGIGLRIAGSSNNLVGGNTAAVRNVISGNTGDGVQVETANTNQISGNYIGTDATGTIDRGNGGEGIHLINASGCTIGGPSVADRNVISGNGGEGIRVDGATIAGGPPIGNGNTIQGNYVGTNAAGTADLGNQNSGIYLRRSGGNTVRGNLVAGQNGFAGIAVCGNLTFCGGDLGSGTNNASGNVIRGNFVGTDAAGSAALGNAQRGVSIDGAPNTVVGGELFADRNVISANGMNGVMIFGAGADNNLVRGNYIGTDVDGTLNLGNAGPGVLIQEGLNNVVSGKDDDRTAPNLIIFNAGDGIEVTGGTGHRLRINRFEANGDLGIDLGGDGITPNDTGDPDTGPNGLQNGPVLSSATVNAGTVTIQGTLNSTANTNFTVDFYVSDECDPSGSGEGRQWFGAVGPAMTNGSGNVSFNLSVGGAVSVGQFVTALATVGDFVVAFTGEGSTSEFSPCVTALPPVGNFAPASPWMKDGHIASPHPASSATPAVAGDGRR